jgi:adenine-specific DNA methylase
MNRIAGHSLEPAERKARGAFFTPAEIAGFIADWAIRSPDDRIFEPSCGEAVFLKSAAARLRALGGRAPSSRQIVGVDVHEESVALARQALAANKAHAELTVRDFFSVAPDDERFDAVIGNPPYVRYQSFGGGARALALQAALRQGVRLTELASSWAAFTVHAAAFLKPEGRLGLVLPAELLAVSYAAEIRRFLLRRFRSVRLVLFENLVFPGVLEEVVLLLAEGHGGADGFEVFQAKTTADLAHVSASTWSGFSPRENEKWTPALLPNDALSLYRELTHGRHFEVLLHWGETYLGAVTGNNDYFALPRKAVRALDLPRKDLLPIVPPGSKHLRDLYVAASDWRGFAENDLPAFLFAPSGHPSPAARRYIAQGERNAVHQAYKCRKRSPWWRVPLVPRPEFFFTYMNHDRIRLVRNEARLHVLNSLYGVKLRRPRRKLGSELLHYAMLNSVTLLGAEVVGRSYGGGMLKHEPREADVIPVPSYSAVEFAAPRLRALRAEIRKAVIELHIERAVELVDHALLRNAADMKSADIEKIRHARRLLVRRRMARATAGGRELKGAWRAVLAPRKWM